MKTMVSLIIMIVIGLGVAFYVGFGSLFAGEPVAEDHELKAVSDTYVIHFSHVVAENTPKGLAASQFADRVSEKTDGWVDVRIYPNGIRYTAQDEFDALKQNEVQMIAPAFSEITVHDPNWYVWDLPYVFDHEADVREIFEGEAGTYLFESIAKRGYKGIAYWDNGFKQITTNTSFIIRPEDLQGRTFRTMPSDVLKDTYRLAGAIPVTYPFNEVYERLRDEDIDATENTLSNIHSKGFFQYQDYLTLTNHNYLGYAVLMNPGFWEALPESYQRAVMEAMEETTQWLREHSSDLNAQSLRSLKFSEHIHVYEQRESEKEKWRKFFEPIYEEYEGIISSDIMNHFK